MQNQRYHKKLDDAVSSEFSDPFREKYSDLLDHDITRTKVNSIIDDYIDHVGFMEKVRKYASMEIDSRMFRSVQYWFTVIVTAIITSAIGIIIGAIVL